MEEYFDIMLADQTIGTASVKREGLYYTFHCQCHLSGKVIYKLEVICGDKRENLGVCVPMDGAFGLVTRVPVKRLGEGKLSVRAVPRHPEGKGKFVPIRAEEPFAYIDRLQKAYIKRQEGQLGIVIPDEDQLPTVM